MSVEVTERGPEFYRPQLFERIEYTAGGCWLWTGPVNFDGYGYINKTPNGVWLVHRLAYELLVGPIPGGHYLEHLCHEGDSACMGGPTCVHRRCVKPTDLAPAPRAKLRELRGL